MDGQTRTGYTLNYAEMVEDANGLYRLGDLREFAASVEEFRAIARGLVTPAQTITAWMDWMSDQGYEVMELPRTSRTFAWGCGSVFVVTPKDGGENRVYAAVGEFRVKSP